MDIVLAGSINGVTRHIQEFLDAQICQKNFNVVWFRFTNSEEYIQKKVYMDYSLWWIPLPQNLREFLSNSSQRESYWLETFSQMSEVLCQCPWPILHLHTLNLMEFALCMRSRFPCKIVTHVHCIPWKGLYNSNMNAFNRLYQKYYIDKDYNPHSFVFREFEKKAYKDSDIVICVTSCAKDFILRMYPECANRLYVVRNGIRDMAGGKIRRNRKEIIRCVFVGSAHPSKGLDGVLEALQALMMKYEVCLVIVGAYSEKRKREIRKKHPFLKMTFKSVVRVDHLKKIYSQSDIGIIGSLQEQCSYAAIEMMMFGLPIVTTDVDGLSEIFSDDKTALKVKVRFSLKHGLRADVVDMSEALLSIIEKKDLQEKLAHQARLSYQKNYSVVRMANAINSLYEILLS